MSAVYRVGEAAHDSLLLLGASVRAAAQSAARMGLMPLCGDLFGDADLPDVPFGQVAGFFPGDLERIAAEAPPAPWMYTGGLENYPHIVAAISRNRVLYGNSDEVLRRVRDPFLLAGVFDDAGLLFADCRDIGDPPPRDGRWLRKHHRSSGGLRVETWLPETISPTTRKHYFQRLIDGLPIGAVYVAAGRRAALIGTSEQLLSASAAAPFRYGGSIAPARVPHHRQQHLEKVGDVLAEVFQLRGLFGVDLISAADGLWVVEVNPRYTASVEVLERMNSTNAIAFHIAACREGRLPLAAATVPRRCWGKVVVYANRPRQVSVETLACLRELNSGGQWPVVADLPRVGTSIARDHPAATVFADGADHAIVQTELAGRVAEVRERLGV